MFTLHALVSRTSASVHQTVPVLSARRRGWGRLHRRRPFARPFALRPSRRTQELNAVMNDLELTRLTLEWQCVEQLAGELYPKRVICHQYLPPQWWPRLHKISHGLPITFHSARAGGHTHRGSEVCVWGGGGGGGRSQYRGKAPLSGPLGGEVALPL